MPTMVCDERNGRVIRRLPPGPRRPPAPEAASAPRRAASTTRSTPFRRFASGSSPIAIWTSATANFRGGYAKVSVVERDPVLKLRVQLQHGLFGGAALGDILEHQDAQPLGAQREGPARNLADRRPAAALGVQRAL